MAETTVTSVAPSGTVASDGAMNLDVVSFFKYLGFGALVGMLLAVPTVTHRTVESGSTLGVVVNWWALLTMAIVGMVIGSLLWLREHGGPQVRTWLGRIVFALFAILLLAIIYLAETTGAKVVSALILAGMLLFVAKESLGLPLGWAGSLFGPAMLVAALIMPMAFYYSGSPASRYWIDIGTLVITYIMLGWGLNIVVGLAGLLDLGYVAFYAVGAYSFALLAQTFGLSFWVCLPLAGMLAALWGVILGFPVLRLRGDYLAIVTLAFGEIIRVVLLNWTSVTGGPAGINRIPRPTFFGLPFEDEKGSFADFFGLEFSSIHRLIFLFYLALALALLTHFVSKRLRRLPIGRAWEALREDEIACRSLGINTTTTKLTAFAIGAMFAGFAGSFFATRQGFISPESFNFLESATILAIVVLGGMGSQLGVVVASIVMVVGIELLRELSFLKQIFGPEFDPSQYRMLLFGVALVAIMIWRPRGIVSSRTPTVTLGGGKAKSISGDLVKEGHG
jgi:branched-chain amino acid transport system permease protein